MTLTAFPRAARGKSRVAPGRILRSLALPAGFMHAQAGTAQAGGTLFLGDRGQPLARGVSTPVKVYTDLGDLCDTNVQYPHYSWGANDVDQVSFAVTLDQVRVCNRAKSRIVGFPGAAISHLNRGAELGLCDAARPIEP